MKINDVLWDMNVRHISFDFWNTLATANPAYTKARTDYLQSLTVGTYYGPRGLSHEDVAMIYTRVKGKFDLMAEKGWISFPTEVPIRYLLNSLDLNWTAGEFSDMCTKVQRRLEGLFLQTPPIILPETKELLSAIQADGYTLSITSNTNFISGWVIQDVLKVNFSDIKWKMLYFSDNEKYSKPHPAILDLMQYRLGLNQKRILHIGDHPVCDAFASVKGSLGYKTMLIKNPADLVQTLTK